MEKCQALGNITGVAKHGYTKPTAYC